MSTLIQPIALLAIILTGYLFKRAGKFKNRDYRIMQVALFNLVLPCAIIYSFATNPHDSSMLWISVFGFVVAFIPPVLIFLTTRHTPVQDRAFTMLNGSGFNIGCFCFPVAQAFLGTAAIVPAAMFDIGNCVMVAAGTNVMTQTLLHIQPGKTLDEQYQGHAPVLPYTKPKDRDARRLARHALLRNVAKGFFGSIPFDTYLVMIVLMLANVKIPAVVATFVEPLANANSFVAMLMVGMLMDLPAGRDDVMKLLKIIGLRLPFGCCSPSAHGSCCRSAPMCAKRGDVLPRANRRVLHPVHRRSARQCETRRLLAVRVRDHRPGHDDRRALPARRHRLTCVSRVRGRA